LLLAGNDNGGGDDGHRQQGSRDHDGSFGATTGAVAGCGYRVAVSGSGLWDRRPTGWALMGRAEVQVGALLPHRLRRGRLHGSHPIVEESGSGCRRGLLV
jgi:hypothetical protein